MVRRSNPDLEFVRVGIGRELRALYSGIVSEAIPEKLADLLKQLDQPTASDRDNKQASDTMRCDSGPRLKERGLDRFGGRGMGHSDSG
jgi:hypothetical protein